MKNLDIIGYEMYAVTPDGKVYSFYSFKFLKPSEDKDGYFSYTLYSDEVPKHLRAHRLVAFAYLNKPDDCDFVNHIDGDKQNNIVQNLEWCTAKENSVHAIRTGLRSSTGGKTYISMDTAHTVCRFLEQGVRPKEISEMLGISYKIVASIRGKEKWKHVSCEYDFSLMPKFCRISSSKVIRICEMLRDGIAPTKIANAVDVSRSLVYKIKNRISNYDISRSYTW